MRWQAATWDLSWARGAAEPGKVRDRSISILHEHVAKDPTHSAARLDLAAAFIQRAADENRWTDLLDALEILLDSSNVGIGATRELSASWTYNTGLALTMLGLSCGPSLCVQSTASASDPWMRELSAISGLYQPAPVFTDATSIDSIASATRQWPSSAVEWLYKVKLQEVARAANTGDSTLFATVVKQANVVAESLAVAGADSSMRQLVAEIGVNSVLANALPLLVELRDSASAGNWRYVVERYHELDNVSKRSNAIRRITNFWNAAGIALSKENVLPLDSISRQESRFSPEIAGRAALFAGTLAARSLQLGDEERFLERASRDLSVAGRRELGASVSNTRAEREMLRGDRRAGGFALLQSLHALRPYPDSRWRHNALWVLAREAWSGGWPLVSEYVVREDLRTAASKPGSSRCEAMIALARVQGVRGEREKARMTLSEVREQISRCGTMDAQEWFAGEIESVVAALESEKRSDAGLVAFVNTVAQRGRTSRTFQPLRELADTYLSSGEYGKAEALARVQLLNLQRQLNGVADKGARRRIIARAEEQLEPVQLAMLRAGKTNEFIRLADHLRALSAGDTAAIPGAQAFQTIRYFLVRDSLIAVAEGNAKRVVHIGAIDRDELDAHLAKVSSRDVDESTLNWFHRQLIAPVISAIDTGDVLAIQLPDKLLAIPFAALRAGSRTSFLVEQFDLMYVSAMSPNHVSRRRWVFPSASKALVVLSDSGVGSSLAPWPALASAAIEARHVAEQLNVGSGVKIVRLTRREATIDAITRELRDATILHFAGHAIGDPMRPDAAALLTGIGDNATHFSIEHLRKLEASKLQVVVLSACESARPGGSRSDAFGSIAQAFSDAGARFVVGATWAVDDEATAVLMREFYDSFAAGRAPVRALASAQRAMIRNRDDRLRAPAHWAGFRIAGNN